MQFTAVNVRRHVFKESLIILAIALLGTTIAYLVTGLALDRQRTIAAQAAVSDLARQAAEFAATGEPIPNDRDISNFAYGTLRMSHGRAHHATIYRVSVSRKGQRIDVIVVADVEPVVLNQIGRPNERVVGYGTSSR